MKNKIIIAGIIFIFIAVASYFLLFQKKRVHYHAGFKVFVDGKEQDFTGARYISLIPCGSTDHKYDQLEKAHLHDFVGDLVHVHRDNAYWNDLFKNIKFPIPNNKPIEGYINGKKVSHILQENIKPYDTVIILIGKHGRIDDYLKQSVTQQRIQAIEKKSESCGL